MGGPNKFQGGQKEFEIIICGVGGGGRCVFGTQEYCHNYDTQILLQSGIIRGRVHISCRDVFFHFRNKMANLTVTFLVIQHYLDQRGLDMVELSLTHTRPSFTVSCCS